MKLIILSLVLFLIGCTTVVPVHRKFPEAPTSILQPCPDLFLTQPTEKLSEVLLIVTKNYTLYHECSAKTDSWIEWYNEQRRIFEELERGKK